jgi:glutathione peroxidase
MKKLSTLLVTCLTLGLYAQVPLTFHNYSVETITGDTLNLSQFYGKKVLVVNTASQCSFVDQYETLQELYDQYHQHNFEIIGFPSDDFNQEPEEDSGIIDVCESYNITFQMMSKSVLKGANAIPVYKWLQQASLNGVQNAGLTWNFNKYLIDEAGHWVRHLTQFTEPLDPIITNWIMSPSVVTSVASGRMDESIGLKNANPTSSFIEFTVKNPEPQHYSIQLYSNDGKLITTIFNGIAANQNISHSVASLSSGLYFINIQTSDSQKTIRYGIVR